VGAAGQQTPCATQNNVGDANVWGYEFEAEWHATDSFMLDASYSLTLTPRLDATLVDQLAR
jgi:outer membrane receptor protein involved in Fe transport